MKKLLKIIPCFPLVALLFLCSCSDGSSNNEKINNKSTTNNTQGSINGLYSYSEVKSIITVKGNRWRGELLIKSGLGSSYDNSNASYSSGIVKDATLYDDSGYIELGSVNGTSLSMPIGSSRVTHYK